MNKKDKALQSTLRIIILDFASKLSRIAMFSNVIQLHFISKIPEIWNSIYFNENGNIDDIPENWRDELNAFMVRDAVENLPIVIWYSMFTSCYSLLEVKLNNICKSISKQSDYKLKLNDLKGRGIIRAKDYLIKVLNIDFPNNTIEWQEITHYSKIRNLILHTNGRVEKENKPIRKYIENNESIWLNEDFYIAFDDNFINFVVGNYITFLEKLGKTLVLFSI